MLSTQVIDEKKWFELFTDIYLFNILCDRVAAAISSIGYRRQLSLIIHKQNIKGVCKYHIHLLTAQGPWSVPTTNF